MAVQAVSQRLRSSGKPFWLRYELPTWGLFLVIHGGWIALTLYWAVLPFWVILPVASVLLAWHNSFQHETIHGHPTKSVRLNAFIGGMPMNLWVPYGIYRDGHLRHHNKRHITNPLEDPESYYITQEKWDSMSPLSRRLRLFYNTLPGRVIIGPAFSIYGFIVWEATAFLRGYYRNLDHWVAHVFSAIPVVLWLVACDIPLWQYFVLAIYPSHSLNMLRSFAEHRASENMDERIAIVESGWFFGLLYLFNNLHVVHHDKAGLAWYEIPGVYSKNRKAILDKNGHYWFRGYGEILRNFWNKPWDHPVHKS